jgi:hypothetical protein
MLEYILIMMGEIVTAGYLYLVQFRTVIYLKVLVMQKERKGTLLQEGKSQLLSSHLGA